MHDHEKLRNEKMAYGGLGGILLGVIIATLHIPIFTIAIASVVGEIGVATLLALAIKTEFDQYR